MNARTKQMIEMAAALLAEAAATELDTETDIGIEWCNVPEGSFLYGDDKETRTTGAYRISQTPITNAQYHAFVDAGGYTERRYWTEAGWQWRTQQEITGPESYGSDSDQPNHPVVGVSWYEAMAFCRWLSEQTGKKITLPTEEQWEKAARGTDGRKYPWGNTIDPDKANYWDTKIQHTTPVGSYPAGASPYGALDMAGNVWEWTASPWERHDD